MATWEKAVTLMLLTLLSISTLGLINAQNYVWIDQPPNTKPIAIEVASPISNQIYNSTNLTVAFYVSTKGTIIYTLYNVTLKASWMTENITVFNQNSLNPEFPDYVEYNNSFSGIPEGNQSIQITANGCGSFADTPEPTINGTEYFFKTSSTSIVNFKIDSTPSSNPTKTNIVTSSPTFSSDRNAPHLNPIYYLIPVSIIVAVALASILIYRRHKKTAKLKQ